MVIDAKYKDCQERIKREDRFQIISYLHYLNAEKAGIVYPSIKNTEYKSEGILKGMGGEIFKQSIKIPQNIDDYGKFVEEMKESETDFLESVGKFKLD
ncbi:hypothetical protein Hs30E_10030 [Lactococcus hodotermopsidis]|uniref:McrBC 5-methylcytosine restriction system component n=2 Tax=Pseudolactococcus hodotermopsidis TaxID=2709157 RepID=A0A6A0BAN4_9LACT|nr:hypothetical protein Hs30E_10030 [Lactococcus hodotermopsidis]